MVLRVAPMPLTTLIAHLHCLLEPLYSCPNGKHSITQLYEQSHFLPLLLQEIAKA